MSEKHEPSALTLAIVERDALRAARDAALAEVERMRPVVEAACEEDRAEQHFVATFCGAPEITDARKRRKAAVLAYRASAQKEGK